MACGAVPHGAARRARIGAVPCGAAMPCGAARRGAAPRGAVLLHAQWRDLASPIDARSVAAALRGCVEQTFARMVAVVTLCRAI